MRDLQLFSQKTAAYNINKGIVGAGHSLTGTPADPHTRWREHYPWFLLPALWLLFLATMPYRLLRGVSIWVPGLLWLALQTPGEVMAAEETAHRAAEKAWQAGDYTEAVAHYAVIPGYVGRMGEGASYYRAEDFAGATSQFTQAVLAAEGEAERADALYNLGNSLFRAGDYAAAIQVFGDVLLYRKDDEQARHNLALSTTLQQAVQARLAEEATACLLYTSPSPRD